MSLRLSERHVRGCCEEGCCVQKKALDERILGREFGVCFSQNRAFCLTHNPMQCGWEPLRMGWADSLLFDNDTKRRRQAFFDWMPTAASSLINSCRRHLWCRVRYCIGKLLPFISKSKLGTTCAGNFSIIRCFPIFDFPRRPPTADIASIWPRS